MNILISSGTRDKDGGYWLPNSMFNGLFYSKDGNNRFVDCFPTDKVIFTKDILKVLDYDEYVFFISNYNYCVYILNKNTKEIKKIRLLDIEVKIGDAIIVNNCLYVMPLFYNKPIAVYDFVSESSDMFYINNNDDNNKNEGLVKCVFMNRLFTATRIEGRIKLIMIDIFDRTSEVLHLPQLRFVNCISAEENMVYIFGESYKDGSVILAVDVISYELKKIIKIKSANHITTDQGLNYVKLVKIHNKFILIPALEKYIISIDLDTHEEKKVIYPDNYEHFNDRVQFTDIQKNDCDIILYPYNYNAIMKFNTITNEISMTKLIMKDLPAKVKAHLSDDIINESSSFNLDDLIKL